MALPYSNCGSGYNWGIMSCRQRRKVGVLGQCNPTQESIHHRAGLAAHNLWNTMHRRQVCIWFDNLRRYTSGADHHSPNLTLNCTAIAVLHTTALPAYRGLPELAEIEARVPKVADDIFRSHRALFDRIDVANQGIQRVWVRAPLDIARKKFVPSTGDPLSCLSSAQAHTKSFCNSWLICHVWNTAPDIVFRCLWT